MKKFLVFMLCIVLSLGVLAGCGTQSNEQNNDKLSIVTTIFPEYDWVMNILGDNAENADVTMLLDSGIDLHNFQPTADDIIKISNCDIFIYVGGESDEWVEDALKGVTNKDIIVIDLLESLGDAVKEEELVEGMEEEDEDEEDQGPEYDEHIWLSLKNASVLCNVIKDALCKADTDYADAYDSNTTAYIEKLDVLDTQYRSAVKAASKKNVLFGDRFPFRYLVDDYGLSYYAAFVGCSAETEASFETIAFLAGKVDELSLSTVLTLEGTDHRIAETVISTTTTKSAKIRSMDSMQSITAADVKNGVTYLSIMEKNLEVLKEALK